MNCYEIAFQQSWNCIKSQKKVVLVVKVKAGVKELFFFIIYTYCFINSTNTYRDD